MAEKFLANTCMSAPDTHNIGWGTGSHNKCKAWKELFAGAQTRIASRLVLDKKIRNEPLDPASPLTQEHIH